MSDMKNKTPEQKAVESQEVDLLAESVKKGVVDGLAEDRQKASPPETDWYENTARQAADQRAKVAAGKAKGGMAAIYPNSPQLWPKDEGEK